jgi:hypothetical protein
MHAMKLNRPEFALAVLHFLLWLGVLYAGADHPPPPGFLWILLLVLVASVGVCLRAPAYAQWHVARRPGRLPIALGEGALAGLVFAALPMLLSVARPDAGLALGCKSVLVWFAVLALVGAANAALVYTSAVSILGRRWPPNRSGGTARRAD